MDIGKIEDRIRTLSNQHISLERTLVGMVNSPDNQFEIEKIKKQKLLIKDELTRLYRTRHEMINEVDVD